MEAVKIIKGKTYTRLTLSTADLPTTQPGGLWTFTPSLPPGLSVDYAPPNGGVGDWIKGTPTQTGRWTGTANYGGLGIPEDYENFDITVYDSPIITAGQLFTGIIGAAFSRTISQQIDQYRPVSSWNVTGLPSWATLDSSTGKITGTPTEAGTYTVTVTAVGISGYPITTQKAADDIETIQIVITEAAPFIDRENAYFPGQVGKDFSAQPSVTDPVNAPATSWSWEYTIAGLSINSTTGAITGTPTLRFDNSIYLTATGPGGSDTSPFFIPIFGGKPIITDGQTASSAFGTAFSKTFSLTDATNRPAISWAATGLPAWASINSSTGAITGTPTGLGNFTLTLTATGEGVETRESYPDMDDSLSLTSDPTSVTISITGGTPIITSGQSASGKVGVAFSKTFSLTDSTNRPVTSWTITGLPSGLSYNSTTGAIAGTPTTVGSATVTITATGPGGSDTETAEISISVGPPSITPGQTGSGKVGAAFFKTFSLTDSTNRPATSWSAAGLPSWATINSSTGEIAGTPQDVETTTITLTATGPGGSDTETATISIAIGVPIITAGQTFTGKVGDAFSANISLDDALDRPATAWAATGLPSGLSINSSTGAITGSPTTIGSFTASIAASNGAGSGASQSVGFTIEAGAPVIAPNQTLTGTVGLVFSAAIALTNSANRPATSYAFSGLPAWAATNSASGIIAGTPTTTGTTTFSVTATGPGGTSEPTNISLVISASGGGGGTTPTTPSITMQLPNSQAFTATVGTAFTATPQVLSGEPVSWYATDLPDWASIDSATGQITGTPTFTGTHYISLTAVDENSLTATGVFILTTVSWNTLELYVDPKGRKMLSKANTRSVLSKMTLKRDDRTPFTIVFVSDTTTFSAPADYNISVGIKQTYGGEYLAYADADSGILDLSTDPVQSLFADEPDQIDALLEIKWEDAATAAIRTITLPLQIQNSVIRGNLSGGGGSVVGPIASGGNSLAPYLAARQIVLTGEQAEETTLSISENLVGPTLFHRPEIGNMPARKGWLSGVSNVTITNEDGVTTPLTAGQDFEFFADRQCFYFTDPETTGEIAITGAASRNSIQFGVSISGPQATPASFTTTHIDTASATFEITAISVESEDKGMELIEGFYFDHSTSTVFFRTPLSASSVRAVFKTNLGDEIEMNLEGFQQTGATTVPQNLWPSITEVTVNGVAADPSTYSLSDLGLIFTPSIPTPSLIVISGPQSIYTAYNFSGSMLTLPESLETVIEATAYDVTGPGGDWGQKFDLFAALEKTNNGTDDILHLGWNYPTGYENGHFLINAQDGDRFYQLDFNWWPGNAFELPTFLDNVHTLALDGTGRLVVFEPATQKLLFSARQSGRLNYSATHKAYEGIARGGETLEIVEEIPGIYATTCGTGHYVSTLRTLSPRQDWYDWWLAFSGIELVQIVDHQNIVIYQDDSEGCFAKARPGYTAPDLKPLTLKLPLAALWGLARRDDTSFFQEAFSPDFAPLAFSSATYPALDDSQRYAADSMAAGKSVTLSTNQSAPVRGVQGVTIDGPSPTYFAGSTIPYIALSTYKWFVVKCTNPAGNPALTSGKRYLLCANNVQLDSKSIMVNITNQGYNIAADLYEIRRAI